MTAPRNIGFTVNHKYRLTCLQPANKRLLPQLPGLRAQMPITYDSVYMKALPPQI
jgi:hypothetical protein